MLFLATARQSPGRSNRVSMRILIPLYRDRCFLFLHPAKLFHIHGASCAALLIPSSRWYRVARRRAVEGAYDASEICATNHKPPSLAGNWIEGAEAARRSRLAWTWPGRSINLNWKEIRSSGVDRYALVFCTPCVVSFWFRGLWYKLDFLYDLYRTEITNGHINFWTIIVVMLYGSIFISNGTCIICLRKFKRLNLYSFKRDVLAKCKSDC